MKKNIAAGIPYTGKSDAVSVMTTGNIAAGIPYTGKSDAVFLMTTVFYCCRNSQKIQMV